MPGSPNEILPGEDGTFLSVRPPQFSKLNYFRIRSKEHTRSLQTVFADSIGLPPHEALFCGNPAATAAQSSFFMLAARHSLITCSSAVSSAPPVPHVRVGAPFTYMPLSHHRIRLAPTVDAGAVGASLCDLGCFDAQNVSILAFRDGCSTGLAHSMLQQPFFGQFQHTAFPQPASFFTAASATSTAQTQPMWFSVRLQARLPKTVS